MLNLITSLKENEIFVFGSNEAGIHGAGAAKTALQWGAKLGVGVGLVGQTYAIPTKDKNIKTLSLDEIKTYINQFILFAQNNPQYKFLVTEIGCGLAGFEVKDIAPLFYIPGIDVIPKNIILPKRFQEYIKKNLLYSVKDKIWFAGEKKPYTIQACDERYLICTKPFPAKHTVVHTIVDLLKRVRGTEDLIFCMGFETSEDCQDALHRLQLNESEISKRNTVLLNITKHEKPL